MEGLVKIAVWVYGVSTVIGIVATAYGLKLMKTFVTTQIKE